MSSIWQDIRFSIRALIKNPSFAVLAIATLALGMGAGTTIFSLVNGLLLRPLPGNKDNNRLFAIAFSGPSDSDLHGASYLDFMDYRAHADAFQDMTAYMLGAAVMTADNLKVCPYGRDCICSATLEGSSRGLTVCDWIGKNEDATRKGGAT